MAVGDVGSGRLLAEIDVFFGLFTAAVLVAAGAVTTDVASEDVVVPPTTLSLLVTTTTFFLPPGLLDPTLFFFAPAKLLVGLLVFALAGLGLLVAGEDPREDVVLFCSVEGRRTALACSVLLSRVAEGEILLLSGESAFLVPSELFLLFTGGFTTAACLCFTGRVSTTVDDVLPEDPAEVEEDTLLRRSAPFGETRCCVAPRWRGDTLLDVDPRREDEGERGSKIAA